MFVPAAKDAPEGQGYLLSTVYRAAENRSDLAIFDAQNVSDGPVACAELPHRVFASRFTHTADVQQMSSQVMGRL